MRVRYPAVNRNAQVKKVGDWPNCGNKERKEQKEEKKAPLTKV